MSGEVLSVDCPRGGEEKEEAHSGSRDGLVARLVARRFGRGWKKGSPSPRA